MSARDGRGGLRLGVIYVRGISEVSESSPISSRRRSHKRCKLALRLRARFGGGGLLPVCVGKYLPYIVALRTATPWKLLKLTFLRSASTYWVRKLTQ